MYRMVSIYARKCFGLTPVGGDAPPECATPRVHPWVGTRRPVVSHPPHVWWEGAPRTVPCPPDVAQSLRRRARAPYVGAQQLSSWIETDTFYATCTIDRFGLDLCWQPLRPSGAVYAGNRCALPARPLVLKAYLLYSPFTAVHRSVKAAVASLRSIHWSRFIISSVGAKPWV